MSGAKMPILLVCIWINLAGCGFSLVTDRWLWATASMFVAVLCTLAWVFSWKREL